MVIAGGTCSRRTSARRSSCFNGAGDGDRRRVVGVRLRHHRPRAASTEPAMVIAGGPSVATDPSKA